GIELFGILVCLMFGNNVLQLMSIEKLLDQLIGRRDLDFWRKVDLMSFFIIASIVTDKLKIHLPFLCLAPFYFF
ncbi:MAG: hypothetical protein RSD44_03445, partial [Akkermansia sp.]